MKVKTAVARIKAPDDDAEGSGEFEALVSVFGNKDSYGDVVMPGAFAGTLAEWKDRGDPIPVIWSHMYQDPLMHIGQVVDAAEKDGGLWVRAKLDLDNPNGAQVHKLLKDRRVTQFSFSYDVVDGAMVKTDGEFAYELRKLKLYEVGPTLIGANQATELLDVKAGGGTVAELMTRLTRALDGVDAKAGRVLSAKNEDSLRTAYESIGQVLAALDKTDQDDDAKAVAARTAVADLDRLTQALTG